MGLDLSYLPPYKSISQAVMDPFGLYNQLLLTSLDSLKSETFTEYGNSLHCSLTMKAGGMELSFIMLESQDSGKSVGLITWRFVVSFFPPTNSG